LNHRHTYTRYLSRLFLKIASLPQFFLVNLLVLDIKFLSGIKSFSIEKLFFLPILFLLFSNKSKLIQLGEFENDLDSRKVARWLNNFWIYGKTWKTLSSENYFGGKTARLTCTRVYERMEIGIGFHSILIACVPWFCIFFYVHVTEDKLLMR
jgi:hypothetical protein